MTHLRVARMAAGHGGMARPLRGHRDHEHHQQCGGDHPHDVREPPQPWHVHRQCDACGGHDPGAHHRGEPIRPEVLQPGQFGGHGATSWHARASMGRMRMSLNLVTAIGGSPIDSLVEALATARDEGFRRVWMAQMPFDGDLLTALAVAMREVDGIEVGSAVLPIQNQHPMQMAQRALTLNTIAGGRFILGLGMTHQAVTEGMWGIPYDKPVRRMREYLDALQPLLAGEAVNAVGETVTARGALQIAGAPEPEVYLAALGPQMLKLCGRRTAGTLTWMCGPKTLGDHIGPTLRAAAEEAGRPAGAVRVVAGVPIS